MTPTRLGPQAEIQPRDILAGLGVAPRDLLATCLALFDDAALLRQLDALWGRVQGKAGGSSVSAVAGNVESRRAHWFDAQHSDDALRLVLWSRVRDGFGLPAKICISEPAAERLGDDVAAAAVALSIANDPGARAGSANLDVVVGAVLQELLRTTLEGEQGPRTEAARARLIAETRSRIEQMSAADQRTLLESVGAERLTDDVVRKVLVTGGALGAFSGGVSVAGFSAYILAAKASALIPLVSGPALVSLVAVLANPLTAIMAAGLVAWRVGASAAKASQARVAIIVTSLLALTGIGSGRPSLAGMVSCFRRAGAMRLSERGDFPLWPDYRREFELLAPEIGETRNSPLQGVQNLLSRSYSTVTDPDGRLARLLGATGGEPANAAVLGGLTLGDIVHAAASIDPKVIEAADFSRVDDITGVVDFAVFADRVTGLEPGAAAGTVANLKGYVAERFVAARLIAEGHQVVFPELSNQEGWDLLVDGVKTQVKCLSATEGLAKHFSHYHFPVIANAELADRLADAHPAWADHVYFVDGYSDHVVSALTEESLNSGGDMLHPHVPLFSFVLSAARSGLGYWTGQVSASQAAAQMAVDGTARAGLAAVGGFAGKSLGLLLFGPAGALVFGSTLPILAQTQSKAIKGGLDRTVSSTNYDKWRAGARQSLKALVARLESALKAKRSILIEKYRTLHHADGPLATYAKARMEEDARYLRECGARLKQIPVRAPSVEQQVSEVLAWVARSPIHAAAYQSELTDLVRVMQQRPDLRDRVAERFEDGTDAMKRGWTVFSLWTAGIWSALTSKPDNK